MKTPVLTVLLSAILLAGAGLAAAQASAAGRAKASAQVSRGEYLVKSVGLCADCHTPHDARGEPVMSQWLMGSPLPFKPTVEMPWAPIAPPIAGLPTMSTAEAVKFMTDGEKPNGTRPLPPMPGFRLNREDAQAVVAYLKSLAPSVAGADRR